MFLLWVSVEHSTVKCWPPDLKDLVPRLQIIAKPSCCPPQSGSFPWALLQFLFGKKWESVSARKCRRVIVTSARVMASYGKTVQIHYPNTTIVIKTNDKEETKSFRALEAAREIFKAAEEQSFQSLWLNVWWDNTIQTKDSSRTTYLMPSNHSKLLRSKSLTFLLGNLLHSLL